jgi:hypothetical protein
MLTVHHCLLLLQIIALNTRRTDTTCHADQPVFGYFLECQLNLFLNDSLSRDWTGMFLQTANTIHTFCASKVKNGHNICFIAPTFCCVLAIRHSDLGFSGKSLKNILIRINCFSFNFLTLAGSNCPVYLLHKWSK